MKRIFGAAITTAALLAVPLATAPTVASSAEDDVACPSEVVGIEVSTRELIRRNERSMVVSLNVLDSDLQYDNVVVTVDGRVQTVPIEADSYEPTRVVVPISPKGSKLRVAVTWTQQPGQPDACRGRTARTLPVVGARDKVGDQTYPRLTGRYRVTYRYGRSGPDTNFWTLRPKCDVFACSGDLRSTGGARGLLQLDRDDGTYEYSRTLPATGFCRITYLDGTTRTVRPLASPTITITLSRVVGSGGRGVTFKGTAVTEYTLTSAAEGAGCDEVSSDTESVRGTRVGP